MVDLREDLFLQSGGKLFTPVWRTSKAEAWTQRVCSCVNRKWHLLECFAVQRQRGVLINKMQNKIKAVVHTEQMVIVVTHKSVSDLYKSHVMSLQARATSFIKHQSLTKSYFKWS